MKNLNQMMTTISKLISSSDLAQGDLAPLEPTAIFQAWPKLTHLLFGSSLDRIAGSAENIADQVAELVAQMNIKATNLAKDFHHYCSAIGDVAEWVKVLTKILAVLGLTLLIVVLTKYVSWKILVTTLAAISLPFGYSQLQEVLEVVESAVQTAHPVIPPNAAYYQANVNFEFGQKTLPFLLFALFASYVGGIVPRVADFTRVLKRFETGMKSFKAGTDLCEILAPTFEEASEFIKEKLGIPIDREPDFVQGVLDTYYNFIADKDFDRNLKTDRETVEKYLRFYADYIKLLKNLKFFSQKQMYEISKITSSVMAYFEKAVKSPVGCESVRPVPTMIGLFGGSGLGKTTITNLCICDIFREEIEEYAPNNPISAIYSRNTEQEFWDGYINQPITAVDDGFQIQDTIFKGDPLIFELIRMTNTWQYPLHMAELSAKDNTYFQSKGIFITGNLIPGAGAELKSVRVPEAVLRRFHVAAELSIKQEYRDEKGKPEWERIKHLLGNKPVYLDIYKFSIIDLVSLHLTKNKRIIAEFDYNSFIDYCRNVKSHITTTTTDIATYITDYFQAGGYRRDRAQFQAGITGPSDETSELEYQMVAMQLAHANGETSEMPPEVGVRVINGRIENLFGAEAAAANPIDFIQSYTSRVMDNAKRYVEVAFRKPVVKAIVGGMAAGAVVIGIVKLVLALRTPEDEEPYEEVESKLTNYSVLHIDEDDPGVAFQSRELMTLKHPRGHLQRAVFQGKVKSEEGQVLRNIEKEDKKEEFFNQNLQDTQIPEEDQIVRNNVPTPDEVEYDTEGLTSYRNLALRTMNEDPEADRVSLFLQPNFYVMHMQINGNNVMNASFLALGGHFMLTNWHVVRMISAMVQERVAPEFVRLYSTYLPDGLAIPVSCFNSAIQIPKTDAAVFKLPRHFHQAKNVVKHFVTYSTAEKFTETAATFLTMMPRERSNPRGQDFVLFMKELSTVSAREMKLPVHIRGQEEWTEFTNTATTRTLYTYPGKFYIGQCGSVIIAKNRHLKEKILGIHMAGSESYNAGYGAAIYQEDLKKAIELVEIHSGKGQKGVEFESVEPIDFGEYQSGVPKGNFVLEGMASGVRAPTKTKLEPSALFDKVILHNTLPAKLAGFGDDDPLMKNIMKAGGPMETFPEDVLTAATEGVKNLFDVCKIVTTENEYDKGLLIPWEFVVNGQSGHSTFPPINMKTSPGYPYVHDAEVKRRPGKYSFFDEDPAKRMSNPRGQKVIERAEKRIELARKGERMETLWIDGLKDERRPIEKVEQGKTRIFYNSPLDFDLAFLRYFGAFRASMTKFRLDNESAIGINPYSFEWDYLAKILQTKGNKCVAGDYSGYDLKQKTDVMWAALDVIENWYQTHSQMDSETRKEHKMIRQTLFSEIVNSNHLARDIVYGWTHGIPSGCPMTAHINTICNSILVRCAYILAARRYNQNSSMASFQQNVSLVAFGDDIVLNISDQICGWFNQETMTQVFSGYDIEFTDETKTATVALYRPLEKCTFLKRGFKQHEEFGRYIGPLDWRVIYEMTNWVRQGAESLEKRTALNVECALTEIAYHGRRMYEGFVKRYQPICVHAGIPVLFPSYIDHLYYHRTGSSYSKLVLGPWIGGDPDTDRIPAADEG